MNTITLYVKGSESIVLDININIMYCSFKLSYGVPLVSSILSSDCLHDELAIRNWKCICVGGEGEWVGW